MIDPKVKCYENVCSSLWKANSAAIEQSAKHIMKEIQLSQLTIQAFPDLSKLLATTSKVFFFLGVTCMLNTVEHLLDDDFEENTNVNEDSEENTNDPKVH